jgi:ribosomal protein S27AE
MEGTEKLESRLCPNCGNAAVQFDIQVLTRVTVQWNATDQCLDVVDDAPISGLEWIDTDDAVCPACGWKGTVADIKLPETEAV